MDNHTTDTPPLKRCKVCSIEKPLDSFYKSPTGKDGHRTICKHCDIARKRINQPKNLSNGLRYCPKCNETKPPDAFSRNKRSKDGLSSYCKMCYINLHRTRSEKRPSDWVANNSMSQKCCPKCGIEKAWTPEFFFWRKDRRLLEVPCLECRRLKDLERYHSNPERERSRVADYRRRNPERVRLTARKSREKNPEKTRALQRSSRLRNWQRATETRRKYNEAHREERREYARHRRLHHPELVREIGRRSYHKDIEKSRLKGRADAHKRRARERGLPDELTIEQWRACLNYWGHRCCICNRPIGLWHTLAEEHWVAIADPRPDNPGNVATNLLPMCHSLKDGIGGCNNTKGHKDPIEWLKWKFGKRKAAEILKRINTYFEWVRSQE